MIIFANRYPVSRGTPTIGHPDDGESDANVMQPMANDPMTDRNVPAPVLFDRNQNHDYRRYDTMGLAARMASANGRPTHLAA